MPFQHYNQDCAENHQSYGEESAMAKKKTPKKMTREVGAGYGFSSYWLTSSGAVM